MPRPPESPAGRHSGERVVVAIAGLAAALTAVVLSRLVFPYLSIDNDETINRLQADAIAHGHLFTPTLGLADNFRPWLAAVSGQHFVFKYTPVVPAMIALSQLATGGPGLYLAAIASATVVMTYLLAIEVLGDRAEAATATVVVAVSPLVVVHSALLLAYLATFVLLEVFAWALIRGRSTGRDLALAVSGLALGLAIFARAFDAAVFALPLLVWAALGRPRRGQKRRPALRQIAAFALPALAVLAGFLAYNAAATGSPLRLTFSLLDSKDALGFGPRQLYPTAAVRNFGLRQSIDGVTGHGLLLGVWVAGGWILFMLAAATVIRRRVHGVLGALLAAGVACPLSYFYFWGPWTATVDWGGARYVGPFYFLPVLMPLALLGARGLVDLWRWRRPAGLAVSVAMTAVTGVTMFSILTANVAFHRQNRALAALVASPGHASKQLIFAELPAPFLMHPSGVLANSWDVAGSTVYAVELGRADLAAVHLMPDRTPYRLVFRDTFIHPDEKMAGRLEQLRVASSDRVVLQVGVGPPATSGMALAVSAFGVRRVYSFGGGPIGDQRVVIDTHGAEIAGRVPTTTDADPKASGLEVSLLGAPDSAGAVVETRQLPLARTGATVELLAPSGPVWTVGQPGQNLLKIHWGK